MGKKKKYYVVWSGHNPGIYDSWKECQEQIQGYKGADFKSFKSLEEAESAYATGAVKKEKKKQRYYVVWRGYTPGIYTEWEEAQKQISGYKQPIYKTFGSKELAEKAYKDNPENYRQGDFKKTKDLTQKERAEIGQPIEVSLCVDAACNAKTGEFEYRAVWGHSHDEVFRAGPFQKGSNNIGEFLGLVHSLAYLKKKNVDDMPIYTDSRTAMAWVRKKKANPKSYGTKTGELIKRAEQWLHNNNWSNPILKWVTEAWGEIPADFGRK